MAHKQTFYFSEGPYLQVLQGLHAALSTPEAFVKLLGGAQTGKSLLCAKLTQYMRRKGFQVIFFDAAVESPEMLRTIISRELELPVSSNFSRLLEDTLQPRDEKPIILIFDDAHLLTDITLLEIYRLAEVQVNQSRILNVLLCGEPSLEKRLLSNREFKSLLLNVSNRFVIEPMDRATMDQFFYRCAERVGVPGLQLEVAAMNYLYKSCRGYPGPALSMCRLIVESNLARTNIEPITKSDIAQLLSSATSGRRTGNLVGDSKHLRMLAPFAAVVTVASVGFIYQQLQTEQQAAVAATENATDQVSPFEEEVASTTFEAEQTADTSQNQSANIAVEEIEPESAEVETASTETETISAQSLPVPAEIPEPVSDSSLALVTAEEIGIDTGAIAQPIFEPLVETEPSALTTPIVSEEEPVEDSVPEQLAEPAVEQIEPELAAVPPETVEASITSEPATEVEEPMQEQLISSVQDWLLAWQTQSLADYFASYHSEFVPRYQDDVAAWRSNRQRVIGNASSIELEMSEFEHVGVEEGLQDVRFWLRYRSPNYSDSTQKKLLMEQEDGRWKIVEEINLQVTR